MLVDENRHIQGKFISHIDFYQHKLAFTCGTTRVHFLPLRKMLNPLITNCQMIFDE